MLAGGTYLGGSASAFGPIRAITDAADGRLLKSNCTDRPPARMHMGMGMGSASIRAFVNKEKRPQVRKRESLLPTRVHMHARAQSHACSIASTALPTFAEYVAGTGEYLTATALRNGLCHDA